MIFLLGERRVITHKVDIKLNAFEHKQNGDPHDVSNRIKIVTTAKILIFSIVVCRPPQI